jgi:hypothetical protein
VEVVLVVVRVTVVLTVEVLTLVTVAVVVTVVGMIRATVVVLVIVTGGMATVVVLVTVGTGTVGHSEGVGIGQAGHPGQEGQVAKASGVSRPAQSLGIVAVAKGPVPATLTA